MLFRSHLNNQRLAAMLEVYRKDAGDRFETYRKDSGDRFEYYRNTMDKALDESEDGLNQVIQFYKDNVELVKNITNIASDLKDVVVLNTANMQRMIYKVEANQFCPVVKERSKP